MNVLRFLTGGEQRLSWLPRESASPTSRSVHRGSAIDCPPVAEKTIFEYSSSAVRFRLENLTKKLTEARARVTHDNCDEPNTRFKVFFTQDIEPLFNVISELDQLAEKAFQEHRNISIPALIQVSKRGILPVTTQKASPIEAIILLENHIADKLTAFQEETEETVLAATANKLLDVTLPYQTKNAHNRSPAEKAFIDALLKIRQKHPSRTHNLKKIYALAQGFVNDKKKYLIDTASNELEITVAKIFHPYETEDYKPGTSPLEGHEVFTKLRNEVETNKNETQSYLEQLREGQSRVLGDKILYTLTTLGITLQTDKKIVRNIDKDNDTFTIPVIYQQHPYDLVVTCELAKKTDPGTAKVLLVDIIADNSSRKTNATVRKLLAQNVHLDLGARGDNLKELLGIINDTTQAEKSLQMSQRRAFKPSLVSVLIAGSLALAGIGLSIHQRVKKLTSDSPAVAQTTPPRRTTLPTPLILPHNQPHQRRSAEAPTHSATPNIPTQATISPRDTQTLELASVTIPSEDTANAEWALAQALRIANESDNQNTVAAVEPLLAANSISRVAHLLARKGESLVTASRQAQHRVFLAHRSDSGDTGIDTWRARGGFHTSKGDTFKLIQLTVGPSRTTELCFVHTANGAELYRVPLSTHSTVILNTASSNIAISHHSPQITSPSLVSSPATFATFDTSEIEAVADLIAIDSKCRAENTTFAKTSDETLQPSRAAKSTTDIAITTHRPDGATTDNHYWDPDGKPYQAFMQPNVETKYIDQDSWKHKVYLHSAKATMWMSNTYNDIQGSLGRMRSWFS